MKTILKGLIISALISTPVSAASYQAQGCGLGSTIFTDGSDLTHQVLGATTNTISGSQTFGMSSGTSNCELDTSGSANTVFIEANKISLSNDIAKGTGATLASLSRMYGCTNHSAIGKALQAHYKTIFTTNASALLINNNIKNIISDKKACI